ncbi:DUF1648 domain-containing protein [Flagellimonas nanhaiensis]|uniref:DUF1648 domain-containing protein n=1 Tax=Flagellimonas nanhaiensis TaxID=2292706 RepID=A0A371JSD5_9FLAO|nr:DUF1648 domain-containing protein [Allomuricauda nanhaiensis]RDY60727.1 DUF1648 domain-containing protein [Allomuricauda nanhaiensis]
MSLFKNQPKIEVKPTESDKKLIKAGWIIVAINILLVLYFYFDLPETIPTHFNWKGEVDGYGHKSTLWIIPVISAALYFGMGFMVTKMKPYNMNYPIKVTEKNAPKLYATGLRMLAVMNLCFVIAFLITTFVILLQIKEMVDTVDVQLLIGLWALNGLIPFYFIYKMYTLRNS